MSHVFLATETALDRAVVIKVLAPELTSEVLATRFRREFQVTAVLGQHPHILPVLSTGTNGGLLYFITPYIEGESLRHRLRREGKLPIDDAVRILSEVASALAFAHEKGIVHRDIKPENVLLSGGHAILADFGISAVLSTPRTPAPDHDEPRLTELGMAMGTPRYMSPEQAAGEAEVDARSDLYSLAVIGYEMLTGAPPFAGDSALAMMNAHLNVTPKGVGLLRPDTPRQVAEALGIALRKAPGDRFQSADAFRAALGGTFSGDSVAAHGRRRWWGVAAGAALLLAVGSYFTFQRHEQRERFPNLVAIAPFEALGTDLGVWREGLADLLASNLDGAGPLRTVPPSVVIRRAPARTDRNGARLLAERTHAGVVIYGSLIASGQDSVRVTATIFETETGRSTDVQLRDAVARMDRLADSLAVAILREMGSTRAIGATRLASLGSSSLPALKAYLQGEQFYRRSDWDSAAYHYQRAIALDSTFAPALRHLSNALGWKLTPGLEVAHEGYQYALLAGRLNRGLAPRESVLVAADSIFAALQLEKQGAPTPARMTLVRRVTDLLDEGVRRFPDDPEMWFKFGDVHYHFARFVFPSRSTMRTARDAFERAIALDSAFAPAYLHQLELAANDQDVEAIRASTAAYLALDPHDVQAQGVRLMQRLLDPLTAPSFNADSAVANADPQVLQSAFGILAPLMDSAETQVAMARTLLEAVHSGRAPGDMARGVQASYTMTLVMRGHLAQALATADTAQWLPFAEAAFLRAVPADSAGRSFDRWLTEPALARRVSVAAVYWSLGGDTARFRRAVQLAAAGKLPAFPPALLPGWHALARGDTTAAIAALTIPDSACASWCWEARLPLAFLLSARKRDREAAAILDQDFLAWPSLKVMWILERARVNERLGVRPKAIDAYLYVANAWRNADPVVQPYVEEARRGLARLNTDPARS